VETVVALRQLTVALLAVLLAPLAFPVVFSFALLLLGVVPENSNASNLRFSYVFSRHNLFIKAHA
jgi:putative exporter of polyketide antibiotics